MTSPFRPMLDRLRRQRAREARQDRRLQIGRVTRVDRTRFPFTADVRVTDGSLYDYLLRDCIVLHPMSEGTLLSGDVQPPNSPPLLRENQTVAVLTGGHLEEQDYIIGEILNTSQDGALVKTLDANLLDPEDTFTHGGDTYQRVHSFDDGQLGVRLHPDVAPIQFYYHD